MPATTTPVTSPPVGVKHSANDNAPDLVGVKVLAVRETAPGSGVYTNINVPAAELATGPLLDIYDVPDVLRTAVAAGTFSTTGSTTGELQGTQPSGSQAGQRFKKGQAVYEYMRGDAGTLVWVRQPAG